MSDLDKEIVIALVLATDLDRRYRSGSGSEPNQWHIGGPGCQYGRTVNSNTVRWISSNPSQLGRLSVGRPAGSSVDLYNFLVFAVGLMHLIKIRYFTANNLFLHVLQSATLIILESVFFLLYIVLLNIEAVNSPVISSFICVKPCLPNIKDQILLTLRWRSVSWWGNVCVMHCFKWRGCHDILYELLPHCDTLISQDARPIIIATPLMLIIRMGQEACCNCSCPYRRSISQ